MDYIDNINPAKQCLLQFIETHQNELHSGCLMAVGMYIKSQMMMKLRMQSSRDADVNHGSRLNSNKFSDVPQLELHEELLKSL